MISVRSAHFLSVIWPFWISLKTRVSLLTLVSSLIGWWLITLHALDCHVTFLTCSLGGPEWVFETLTLYRIVFAWVYHGHFDTCMVYFLFILINIIVVLVVCSWTREGLYMQFLSIFVYLDGIVLGSFFGFLEFSKVGKESWSYLSVPPGDIDKSIKSSRGI